VEDAKVVVGEAIHLFRMTTLLRGLGLEIKGMKKRGRSCYSIIKAETGLKGNKQKVYDQYKAFINEKRRDFG
jgi:hypothetical protein